MHTGRVLGADALVEVEGDAELLIRRCGYDPGDPPGVVALVAAYLGSPPQRAPIRAEGSLVRVEDQRRVYVRRGLSAARARWVAGHELAHAYYADTGYCGEDLEARCDALGAALCLPRPFFRRAHARLGPCPGRMARVLGVTPALAHLRLGEVTGRPVVLWRPGEAIHRGEPFVWPELSTLLRRSHPGLRRVHLRTESWRLAVRVSERV
jgi:hypothetical protein